MVINLILAIENSVLFTCLDIPVGLLDETSGDFFSGDVIYQGPMLDCLPYSNTSDNLESIENILSFSDKVKRVYPGHLDTFDGKKLKEIAEGYLRKFGMCHDCT